MKVLFDTNVVLDVLLNRQPYAIAASQLMVHVEKGTLDGLLAVTTLTTIHYLARKAVGSEGAREQLHNLLSLFNVAPVGKRVLLDALSLDFPDYEDAVLHEAARHAGAAGIITRDRQGFARATLPIYCPEELLRMLQALQQT